MLLFCTRHYLNDAIKHVVTCIISIVQFIICMDLCLKGGNELSL